MSPHDSWGLPQWLFPCDWCWQLWWFSPLALPCWLASSQAFCASWLVSCSHPCGLLVFKREETELDDRCWILDGLKNCISGIKVEFCASIWLTFFFPQDPDAEAGGLRILSETWQLRKSYPKIAQTPKNKQTKQNPRQANSPFSWSPPCFSYPWAVNVSCRN